MMKDEEEGVMRDEEGTMRDEEKGIMTRGRRDDER